MNASMAEWFRTTAWVRQGHLLSPTHHNQDWCSGRTWQKGDHNNNTNTDLLFVNDTYNLTKELTWTTSLSWIFQQTHTRYKIEIHAGKTIVMTNSANTMLREVNIKGEKMGKITSFRYLEAIVSDDSSRLEVLSKTAQTNAARTNLKTIWSITTSGIKDKTVCSLVISIYFCLPTSHGPWQQS